VWGSEESRLQISGIKLSEVGDEQKVGNIVWDGPRNVFCATAWPLDGEVEWGMDRYCRIKDVKIPFVRCQKPVRVKRHHSVVVVMPAQLTACWQDF
jgi:hypothetical protein